MHLFWIMIFLSFDFLDTSKKGKYDYFVAKSGKSLFFAWKVGKMSGRTCVVCDQVKNVHAHTLCTHILKVSSHAHVRPHIARVRARSHLRNSYLVIGGKLTVLIMNGIWYLDETDTWVLFSQSTSQ